MVMFTYLRGCYLGAKCVLVYFCLSTYVDVAFVVVSTSWGLGECVLVSNKVSVR